MVSKLELVAQDAVDTLDFLNNTRILHGFECDGSCLCSWDVCHAIGCVLLKLNTAKVALDPDETASVRDEV